MVSFEVGSSGWGTASDAASTLVDGNVATLVDGASVSVVDGGTEWRQLWST